MPELHIDGVGHPAILLVLRAVLVSAFLVSAVAKIRDFAGATGEVRALTGLEPAAFFAALVIAVQFGGAILVIAGGSATRIGAVMLGGFTLIATVAAHAFWKRDRTERVRDLTIFFEHMGLIAGLCLAVALAESTERIAQ